MLENTERLALFVLLPLRFSVTLLFTREFPTLTGCKSGNQRQLAGKGGGWGGEEKEGQILPGTERLASQILWLTSANLMAAAPQKVISHGNGGTAQVHAG